MKTSLARHCGISLIRDAVRTDYYSLVAAMLQLSDSDATAELQQSCSTVVAYVQKSRCIPYREG